MYLYVQPGVVQVVHVTVNQFASTVNTGWDIRASAVCCFMSNRGSTCIFDQGKLDNKYKYQNLILKVTLKTVLKFKSNRPH